MHGGDTADTQVDSLVSDLDLNTPILRNAFFGDIHRARHDLESADDGALKFFRRALNFLKVSVDSVTDADPLFHRLDVDIARPVVLGFDQDIVDHPDDWGRVIAGDILFLGHGD